MSRTTNPKLQNPRLEELAVLFALLYALGSVFWLLGQCKCWSLETFVGLLVLFMDGLSLQASSHQILGEGSARTVVNAMRVNVPIT